jgi:hypothetical protein
VLWKAQQHLPRLDRGLKESPKVFSVPRLAIIARVDVRDCCVPTNGTIGAPLTWLKDRN